MKQEIMQKIKEKKIRMRPAFIFLAQKLGLQSILALSILAGALLLNIFLYFLKKTGVMKFMVFGWPGLKIILMTLPYDYIALFIITIALASFIIRELDLSRGISMNSNVAVLALVSITLLLGSFFAVSGVEVAISGWSKNKIPVEKAVSGRVLNYSNKQIIIRDDEGVLRILNLENDDALLSKNKYEINKVLRAVGRQDDKDSRKFHVEVIKCCDED